MANSYSANVVGEGGLRGTLVDPYPQEGENRPVRLKLDDGRTIEIPSSLLRKCPSGCFSNRFDDDLQPESL
jgi:hypothetical protein